MNEKQMESARAFSNASISHLILKKPDELEKSALEFHEQQAASASDHAKRLFPVECAPFFYMAQQGVDELIRMQKSFLGLTLEYWAACLDSITSRLIPKLNREMVHLVSDAADRFTTGREQSVEFAIQQDHRSAGEVDSFAMSASKEADAFQRGIDIILGAQEDSAMKPSEVVNEGEFWSRKDDTRDTNRKEFNTDICAKCQINTSAVGR